MDTKRKRVVIIGGGFGGLEAAKSLARADVEVVLIDRGNYYLFQPLLYQVAMAGLSAAEIASPIRGILAGEDNARVIMGEVTRIDLDAKRVHVDGNVPQQLEYDWLILAAGARSVYFGHDEWEAYAPSLKRIEDALEIRRRVLLAFERAERIDDPAARKALLTFVVIGGGPTGVELAGALSELSTHALTRDYRAVDSRETKVILIEAGARILPTFPEDLAESAVEQLGELDVEVKTGARVVAIDGDGVVLERPSGPAGDGAERPKERIEAHTIVWAAGVRASELGATLGVEVDKQGRVVVGPDCSIPGRPDVFVIGDMARFEENGNLLPGVSPVAMQQARYVAKIIRWEAESMGRPPRKPFHYFDKGSMATIGRSRAIAVARGIKMTGFIAWLAWLFVHIWYLIGFKNRIFVLLDWTWSYIFYGRGARLITSTGWTPTRPLPLAPPREALHEPMPRAMHDGQGPAPPEAARPREPARPRARAPIPT